jgi:uncharacterized protein YbjT (DUF2867 family)
MRRFSISCGWPEKSSISLGRIVFSNSLSAEVKFVDSLFRFELGILAQNYKILLICTFTQMKPAKSALLLGATGLTGGHLLSLLLESENYHTVTVYARTSTGVNHPKLREKIIDYDSWQESVAADDVFCCLGTTIKKAKTQEAFKKVDLQYPVKIGRLQYKAGSKKFLVISAIGASSHSMIFYSRVKGTMEEQLQQIGYPSLYIFRPSLITGQRKQQRAGEKIAVILFKLFSPLLVGPLKKYKPASAQAIAKAMLHSAQTESWGTRIISSDEIGTFD